MRLVRFLSRVAFICNICFLVASFSRYFPQPPENSLTSDIIVLGYILSLVFNLTVSLLLLFFLLIGRLRKAAVPLWLLIVNFLFFIIQLVLLILNHPLQ